VEGYAKELYQESEKEEKVTHFDDLLDALAHTFYGYENYKGGYWFVSVVL